MMKRYKIAIFDCDGVLFDTREANRHYYNEILKKFRNRLLTEEELSFVHMQTADEAIKYLFKDMPEVVEEVRKYAKEIIDYGKFMGFMRPEPEVFETLGIIKPEMHTALFTNRSTTMPRLIKDFSLDKWFDKIVCAMDVERPKPDPEGMLMILRELDIPREKAIYIGDSVVDEEVAIRSGVPLIAYKNKKLKAMFHVKRFSEIAQIILSN